MSEKNLYWFFLVIGVCFLVLKVFVFGLEANISFSNMDLINQIIIIWGAVGGFIIWVWMISDFFENKTDRVSRPKTWGFLLILGTYIVACIYFIVIYFPRSISKRRRVKNQVG